MSYLLFMLLMIYSKCYIYEMIATFEEEIEEGNLNTVMNYEDEPE